MKVNQISIAISILAAICFFVSSFTNKNIVYFILGCAWVCITIEEFLRIKNRK